MAQAKRFHAAYVAWFGEGEKPVPIPVAQARADTCKGCPKHVTKPMQELLTGSVGRIVQAQLELKHRAKLHVAGEETLHTCGMCECFLPLKVWQKLERARAITPDWASFPEACWLRTEAPAPTPL